MEKVTTTGSGTTTFERKASQLSLFIQALVFTSILYLTAGMTLPTRTVTGAPSSQASASLLRSVKNAVLHEVAQSSGVSTSALEIVQAQQQTWSDDCLGVRTNFGVLCTETPVPGWQVTVISGSRRWVYHTNASGSVVKLAYRSLK